MIAELTAELSRCNKHILGLGQRVKESLTKAGIIGYQFGTVGVSDAISMGTVGMSYSLQSRDLIADQVETAAGGHWLDGMVVVPGCDKNMPGVLMARKCQQIAVTVCLLNYVSPDRSWTTQSSRVDGLRRNDPSWTL